MDWIHCNGCFSQLEPELTLHLTSCGHMFCNNCLKNGVKEKKCVFCRIPCSIIKLVPNLEPEIQDYFTDPEEIIKKSCEVMQFQKQHRTRLLSYLLKSTKKFSSARNELKRMTEVCQKQHKKMKEYRKLIKILEAELANQSSKQSSPLNIQISPTDKKLSPNFILSTPSYKRPANSTPTYFTAYTPRHSYQSNLLTPSRISKQRPVASNSAQSQISTTPGKISSTVFSPPSPESVGSLSVSFNSESGYFTNSMNLSPSVIYCNGRSERCNLNKIYYQ